jgi:hypothetical protein
MESDKTGPEEGAFDECVVKRLVIEILYDLKEKDQTAKIIDPMVGDSHCLMRWNFFGTLV